MQTFVQRSGDRGGGQVAPWLHTRHTFSFGDWHDPRWMGWGPLRVLNDDIVAPKSGFGFHPHRDMEIVTYVLEGEIRHKDSHGNAGRIRPGEAQRMSAGSGVLHSEWNDAEGPCAFLQVWVRPREEAKGGPFSYQHARIP
ncbi:MAG TPA: pirin family protein, partial [Candidatus Thermoplasmatota archaeon]|nr:pirin family protein [Candidatus Thermoplasmatota archaeon]